MEDDMEITIKVLMETSKGNITLGLYGKEMPITTANFLKYVESGFYTKLLFHRVIEDFMIQGGGMIAGLFTKKEPFAPIKLEISPNIKHEQYVLSTARTNDPNSATSQFFICTGKHTSLDGQYAAFGIVVEGKEVVDAIAAVETHSVRHYDDVPVENVVINKMSVVK